MSIPPGLKAQAEAIAAGDGAIPMVQPGTLGSTSSTDTKPPPTRITSASTDWHTSPIEQVPPPIYSERYGHVDISQDGFGTQAATAGDGRVNIRIHQTSRKLSDLLAPTLRSQRHRPPEEQLPALPPPYIPSSLTGVAGQAPPPLNVVIHVVGSRGDVQPFVALGKVLRETYGHRVRLATHGTFRSFVEENGLEFFTLGGDPAELMAFMVKNPGLMPGMDTLRSGDVGKRRKGMYEIVKNCWRSCFEVGDGTGVEVSDDHMDGQISFDSGMPGNADLVERPFVADAIIANPPSFAHIHCAEKLGIPLHLMFTMPWSPTQAFPHPLANIQSSNADTNMTNFISYALVEMMTWQGLGDIINRFRERSLGLEPVSLMWAPGMASRLRIPYTYCWSPALIPKPKDWGSHISISGFFFLSLANTFVPDPELTAFLEAGAPPIYIGFGSIVVDDPNALTKLIFEAVQKTGQRALVSKGWGGFGADTIGTPDGVYMLGNVPHDWLFRHVSCVVHHGGAGTTAAGIASGKPTVVVPFFGDQPFWGAMVAKAGAGPTPISSKNLTADKLAAAIREALTPDMQQKARDLSAKISSEKGCDVGAKNFHDMLGVDSLRCTLAPSRAAVWRVKRTNTRLSAFAAATLGDEGLLNFNNLKLYRPREYDSEDGPWDPISGGASALLGTIGSLMMGVADFPVEILRALRIKPAENGSTCDVKKSDSNSSSQAADAQRLSPSDSAPSLPEIAELPRSPMGGIDGTRTGAGSPASDVLLQKAASPPGTPQDLQSRASEISAAAKPPDSLRSSMQQASGDHHQRCESPTRQISLEAALGTGKGVGRIVSAGLKSPMDFTLSLARGFHNAPKLYGDESVRESEKITGFQSGLKAAGKEFGFGFYDGISGLVTQPLEGAKKEGMAGFIKGFGKGIGGVVLKPGAAIWGIPGYTFKGIYKELQKHFGSSVQNYIIASRTAQGYDDWGRSSTEERLDVINRWHVAQAELGNEKHKYPLNLNRSHSGTSKQQKGRSTSEGSKSHSRKHGQLGKKTEVITQVPTTDTEPAVQDSITATSRGDPEGDMLIEQAIQASIAELHVISNGDGDSNSVERAIQASLDESSQAKRQSIVVKGEHGSHAIYEGFYDSTKEDDPDIDTDDDENIKIAIERSQNISNPLVSDSEETEYQKAIEDSKRAHDQQRQAHAQMKTEEEIVLNYVKRQSLAEEEYRRSLIS